MKRLMLCLMAAVVAVAVVGATASAQFPIVFDENTYPTNPENGFGAFRHGEFSAAGAFTDGPTSLILDVFDRDGNGNAFGGVGVDYGTPPSTNQHNFDPTLAQWKLRIKKLSDNTATAIRSTYIDHDGGFPVTADEHIYEFDLNGVPMDGQFHVLTKSFTDILFSQGGFGFNPGDGINNPGLRQIQIQSVFGSTDRLNVEVDYLKIVPEPASLAMLGLAAPALVLAGRRRRAAA